MKHLIKAYLRDFYPTADNEWQTFIASKHSLAEKIEAAILSMNSAGVMHGHQRRVGLERLKKYSVAMLTRENVDLIKQALRTKTFENVYRIFLAETRNHYMVGPLTAYDVAQRICSIYNIEPDVVYLHTGVTQGAKNLCINVRSKEYLTMDELPKWLTSELNPSDIENFLCIYKDDFKGKSNGRASICPPKRFSNKRVC